MKDKLHLEIRDEVETCLKNGLSIEEIAKKLSIPIGTRYIKGSAKWYKYCIIAKENQRKAIQKHPNLYSKAGKIVQQKHPWTGKNLGKKYGAIGGRISSNRLRGNSEYFSRMAKKLQKINPNHSRDNMKKAHETMKRLGKFNEHQRLAALKCKEKNPNQLKEMSKKAHELHPLALLALESRRKNYPYEFMGCYFDSEQERLLCKKLVEIGLIENPIEKVNVHFRIGKCHVDFFIQNRIFVEFHPPLQYGRKKGETTEGYYKEKRRILDLSGYKEYPLVVIGSLRDMESEITKIRKLVSFKLD
ncbi:MAG: hypothetical protein V1886_00305 [archaeon]